MWSRDNIIKTILEFTILFGIGLIWGKFIVNIIFK